ncbi:MAG: CIA30 family protein [Rhodobacterales bacterium]
MKNTPKLVAALCPVLILALFSAQPAGAQMPDGIRLIPDAGWTYVSDQVMGGQSTGGARIETVDGQPVLRLTGDVSTANRGGFLQTRITLDNPPPDGVQGVTLKVRGNGEGYFVHLRTTGTVLPWQYYQASFPSTPDWAELRIPFSAFEPSGNLLRGTIRPETIRSLGVVAYGRDHRADVSVMWAGFY